MRMEYTDDFGNVARPGDIEGAQDDMIAQIEEILQGAEPGAGLREEEEATLLASLLTLSVVDEHLPAPDPRPDVVRGWRQIYQRLHDAVQTEDIPVFRQERQREVAEVLERLERRALPASPEPHPGEPPIPDPLREPALLTD